MSEKVKLPKNICDALDWLKKTGYLVPSLTLGYEPEVDSRTTEQIERELLGEVLNRLTSLQLSTIQTNGELSFMDILQEVQIMIEETEE